MRTKADLISAEQLDALDRTPFGGSCASCGEILVTEGDFARHFLIPDERYLNLGECPMRRAFQTIDAGVDSSDSQYMIEGLEAALAVGPVSEKTRSRLIMRIAAYFEAQQ